MLANDQLLSYTEAARILGVDQSSVSYYVKTGRLTPVIQGKRPYIQKSELADFIKPRDYKKLEEQATENIHQTIKKVRAELPRDKETLTGALILGLLAGGGIVALMEGLKRAKELA